ncbi:MAG TPA: WGR domain-containing protein [Ensifer sp.]|jgi:predicted DNA-binding WGR domain protein|uniref:WGR domain-containing protein n=1 Tax=Ensifer sp. TaxID=1872086 RepID=UPI002E160095|nr:WGR domain-containing protein [Ensifer sp.]
MLSQPYDLYIERTDPRKNMARFYAMSIDRTLFGTACLTRRWGRIGTIGQSMAHHFDNEMEAVTLFLDLLKRKRRRGYQPPTPFGLR